MAKEFDVKENFEELHKGFEQFKAEHKKGSAADKELLARIEKEIVERDAKNQAFVTARETEAKALKEQIDALEKKIARGELGTGGVLDARVKAELEKKEAYSTYLRYGHPDREPGAGARWAAVREEKGLKLETKALTLADDTTGGFLAIPDFVKEIIKAEVLFSPLRPLVKVRQTSNASVQLPKRTGTAAAVWTGESTTRVESQNPSYARPECPTHELTAEIYVSFQDLEDSAFDLEAEMREEFAEQFAVSEGAAIVAGNGVAKPFGFTDAGQSVASTNSGASATIQDANGQGNGIIDMQHAVKSAYAAKGTFLLARQTLGSVRKLQDAQKRYLWEPAVAVGLPSMILGSPYVEVPDMPLEGANTFPIAFGDWKRAYTLVDRLTMSVMRDPYTKASQGQVKFLARRRVGGQVVLAEAVRLLKCHV